MDAGIYLEETAPRALIEHNNILDNSVGVYLHGSADAMVRENKIVGDATLRVNERGNGVTVWNAPGAQVVGNDISKGRDGIFSNTSTHNTYKNNRFSDLRFAVHYMYTNDSEISGNISVGNNMGYVLMFSERLKVFDNIAVGSRDQGIMLNYVNYSDIHDNIINKAGKCVFAYNANYDKLSANHFENCQIGIHFTAAIEGTSLHDNSFINNESQVKYVSTRFLDWSEGGHGNYLERQQCVRFERRRLRRQRVPAQRHHRPNHLARARIAPLDEQSRHQHRQMGAGAVSRRFARRRGGQQTADEALCPQNSNPLSGDEGRVAQRSRNAAVGMGQGGKRVFELVCFRRHPDSNAV